ncbi:MAG: chorismate mutase [Mycobacterium sp.]
MTDLVDAAAQRLQIAEPVAAFKWGAGTAIEDPARVREQLTALAADATAHHVDPDYVTRVFADQIAATGAAEYQRFAQWKLDPASTPSAPPDLSDSRARIDTLNQVMVAQIEVRWDLLHSPECAARLDEAQRDVGTARQLDTFDQRALSFATRSYCQP